METLITPVNTNAKANIKTLNRKYLCLNTDF